MRYLVVIAVPGVTFGPIFMVMSGMQQYPSPIIFSIIGTAAAIGLSFGLVYLLQMLRSLKNELDELKKHGANDAV